MPDFKQPRVKMGDTVLYAQTPDSRDWYPAVVTVEAHGNISVAGFADTDMDMAPYLVRNGVRHIDDPWLNDPAHIVALVEDNSSGVWKESDQEVRLQALEQQINLVQKSLHTKSPARKPTKKGATVAAS